MSNEFELASAEKIITITMVSIDLVLTYEAIMN